jgi:hypothetical protein
VTDQTCTVVTDATADIDTAERCDRPAVTRLAGELDFPVCAEHAALFTADPEETPWESLPPHVHFMRTGNPAASWGEYERRREAE